MNRRSLSLAPSLFVSVKWSRSHRRDVCCGSGIFLYGGVVHLRAVVPWSAFPACAVRVRRPVSAGRLLSRWVVGTHPMPPRNLPQLLRTVNRRRLPLVHTRCVGDVVGVVFDCTRMLPSLPWLRCRLTCVWPYRCDDGRRARSQRLILLAAVDVTVQGTTVLALRCLVPPDRATPATTAAAGRRFRSNTRHRRGISPAVETRRRLRAIPATSTRRPRSRCAAHAWKGASTHCTPSFRARACCVG